MANEKKQETTSPADELARLRAENEALKKKLDASAPVAASRVSDLYTGPLVRYRITAPHYCKGEYFEAGSIIVKPASEKPSSTWVRLDEVQAEELEALAPPKAPATRPADRSI